MIKYYLFCNVQKVFPFITHRFFIVGLFTLLALVATIQAINGGEKKFDGHAETYTQYNNYVIFKNSHQHLKDNTNLYKTYPKEQWDLFKYTPTFAALFGVFSIFPDGVGLFLWNLVNVLLVILGIYLLPKLTNKQKASACFILVFEMMTTIQNEQSNGLITGLLLLTYVMLERNRLIWAALLVMLSVYVKLFGLVGLLLFVFYPNKLKSTLYILLWSVVLFLIPLLFINWHDYEWQIRNFVTMLQNDHSASYGYSVMGWLHSWFSINANKLIVLSIGALLLISPLIRIKQYKNIQFRLLTLISILIWVVIFNHKAESPTFIIAMTGVALWFVTTPKNLLVYCLFILAFILTSLSPTDLFPSSINENWVQPYALKAFPCILIWCYILIKQLRNPFDANNI